MTRLTWDSSESIRYELGVDRGVFYPRQGPGVPWNGLVSVNEDKVGGDRTSYYHDGSKFAEGVSTTIYSATLKALSCPREFLVCIGEREIVPGFSVTGQRHRNFNLSYRTLIGDIGYKIHLIYNASAMNSGKNNRSRGTTGAALEMEWRINAVPPIPGNFAPTAHFVVDSTEIDPTKLELLETYLYGNDVNAPAMPGLSVLIALINS